MKSVGEIMSIGQSFEEIMQKRSSYDRTRYAWFCRHNDLEFDDLDEELANPTDLRILLLQTAF